MTKRTRARGFAPWSPQPRTAALVADVQAVLEDFADFLPLTIRQVFYRLVASRGYDKTEQAYGRLCEAMNRARRAGMIPWEAIRDDGATRREPTCWDSPDAFRRDVAAWARTFRLDRQEGQPTRLWLLCEAAGMVPMLARAASPYGVPVMSSGGFDSVTVKRDLAHELGEVLCDGTAAEVLHIGDFDPSGEHVFTSLAEDVGAMVVDLGSDARARFTRLAVTQAQVTRMGLPTSPPKKTDRRSFTGTGTVQAEAIPPDMLSGIVRDAIEARQDADNREAIHAAEDAARRDLTEWARGEAR